MTIEEKRERIKTYCGDRPSCISPDKCPLADNDLECYDDAYSVEQNYETLFGDNGVAKEDPINDPVNHPSHYTSGGIECIDAIAASMTPIEYAGFLKGQVLKYVWRYRLKDKPLEDLKKARYYLDRLIQITEKEEVAV